MYYMIICLELCYISAQYWCHHVHNMKKCFLKRNSKYPNRILPPLEMNELCAVKSPCIGSYCSSSPEIQYFAAQKTFSAVVSLLSLKLILIIIIVSCHKM